MTTGLLPTRRLCMGAAIAALTIALTGCQTPPPPAKFTPSQVQVLRDLGFVEVPDGWSLSMGGKVLFGFGEDKLGPTEVETVAHIARLLHKVELNRLRVEGHTDNVGEPALNMRLSTRRAEVVAQEFSTHGIPAANIQARGLGMTRPVADNATEAGRAQNRRVTVIVLSE